MKQIGIDGVNGIWLTYSSCIELLTDHDVVNERLAILLAVNPKDEERRGQLKKDMEKIVKAQQQLEAMKDQHLDLS